MLKSYGLVKGCRVCKVRGKGEFLCCRDLVCLVGLCAWGVGQW
jgi:hypothetical protein